MLSVKNEWHGRMRVKTGWVVCLSTGGDDEWTREVRMRDGKAVDRIRSEDERWSK